MSYIKYCPACQHSKFKDHIRTTAQMHPSSEVFQFQQCKNCDLVFLNPKVPQEDLKNYYNSYYLPYRGAAAWGKFKPQVAASQDKLDKKRAAWVGDYQGIDSQSVLLDIGCGKPTFLQACAQKYQCKCIGLDFTNEGWKDNAEDFKNLNLLVGEVKDLSVDLQPDMITMWHYLEHDYDPVQTLQHLKKISKRNTRLLIEVPNFESESRKKYGEYWAGYHSPRHTFLFSPDNLKRLLAHTGWTVETSQSFGTLDPYVLYWMSEMERKKINWEKNMESEFFNYVLGMIRFIPKRWQEKSRSLGIMTLVAKISDNNDHES